MSKHHLFGPYVCRFLLEDVVERNLSLNTKKSYRDTFKLLFRFMTERYSIDPIRLTVEQVSPETVRTFLNYLEQVRKSSASTRNKRLTAIHSIFKFIARQEPELIDHAIRIQDIPLRRTVSPQMCYLEKDEMNVLLAVPDRNRPQGQREYALLLFLYNTGARADETVHITIGDLNLDSSPSVQIIGKGRKIRCCPLWSHTVNVLKTILGPRREGPQDAFVFLNIHGKPFTRFGVYSLVVRTVEKAAKILPSLQKKQISPHSIRHSTAVHLLRAGVDINTIRAWLGHASLETTNRYAEVDLEMKARALETCATTLPDQIIEPCPIWRNNRDIMAFLDSL